MVHSNFNDGNVTPLFFSGCLFLHLVAKASALKGCGGMVTLRMGSWEGWWVSIWIIMGSMF
jgi:hypothetical protein